MSLGVGYMTTRPVSAVPHLDEVLPVMETTMTCNDDVTLTTVAVGREPNKGSTSVFGRV